jgi:hypothetical protein
LFLFLFLFVQKSEIDIIKKEEPEIKVEKDEGGETTSAPPKPPPGNYSIYFKLGPGG